MPKPKQKDLEQFQNWLIQSHMVGARTANVYASFTRKLLKELSTKDVNTTNLDQILASDWTSQSRDMYYVSWNRFVEFMKTHNYPLPSPSQRSGKRQSRKQYDVPSEIFDALSILLKSANIKLALVPFLKWRHVQVIPSGKWEVADPLETGLFYRVPSPPLLTVYRWSAGGEICAGTPLMAIVPGDLHPIPINPLRRLLRAHKRNPSRS
jgi:hypothetical protein